MSFNFRNRNPSKILLIIYNQLRLRPIRGFLLAISLLSILFLSYQLFSIDILESEEIGSYRKHLSEQKKNSYPDPQLLALLLSPNQIPFQSGKPKLSEVLGVSPIYYKYYTGPMLKFHCLTNKTILLDWYKVNDDYCDCPDGSDEPSTAACMNGRFFCAKTKKSNYADFIPSSRVNDGICDCCDGSDEYTTQVKCPTQKC